MHGLRGLAELSIEVPMPLAEIDFTADHGHGHQVCSVSSCHM
jgi:hypothetical protein